MMAAETMATLEMVSQTEACMAEAVAEEHNSTNFYMH